MAGLGLAGRVGPGRSAPRRDSLVSWPHGCPPFDLSGEERAAGSCPAHPVT
jgi:hypothetical protein